MVPGRVKGWQGETKGGRERHREGDTKGGRENLELERKPLGGRDRQKMRERDVGCEI
jgi:hypothetical protein